jgi:dipeptide/tripeptide permease
MMLGQQGGKAPARVSFPQVFWTANLLELVERAAFYGFYISITLYLTHVVGFGDRETGVVAGVFVGTLYFLTPFVGALSDRVGYKRAMVLAFSLLTAGYGSMTWFHGRIAVLGALLVIAVGSSFVKPLVSGTVARTTSEDNRARGYALFYWVVNIGSFAGKTVVPFIRIGAGLPFVNLFAAALSLLALVSVLLFYHPPETGTPGRTLRDVAITLGKVLSRPRLMIFILIVSGFWTTQYQLYATMPKYVIRLLGPQSKPEWIANINPLIVVCFVVLITKLMKRCRASTSIMVGMLLVPVAAGLIALGQVLEQSIGPSISILGLFRMHPLVLMLILGIAVQGFAESFISPRYLEYFSLLAPKGEEAAYMGFGYLYSFFAAIAGFILSGVLLDKYCPDPRTLPAGLTELQRAAYYQGANRIWFYFIGIGILTAVTLRVFVWVTEDRVVKDKQASV